MQLSKGAKKDEVAGEESCRGGVSDCWDEAMSCSFSPLLPTTGGNLEQQKVILTMTSLLFPLTSLPLTSPVTVNTK